MAVPEWAEKKSERIVLTVPGKHDFHGTIRAVGNMPKKVKEYGKPALQVKSDNVTVKNFAWRGSMEGVHVGSRSFNPKEMRLKHQPIRVTLAQLFCDDIGEDCVSIQPRAVVTIKNSQFRGNHKLKEGDGETPGLDKIVQIDGAEVVIEGCTFFNGFTAVRGKANSRITVRNCKFVNCNTAIFADGMANPRPREEYDNGKAGLCSITVENCSFWDCNRAMLAQKGAEITYRDCKFFRTLHVDYTEGGTVTKK
jgi:hypothetical protein